MVVRVNKKIETIHIYFVLTKLYQKLGAGCSAWQWPALSF
jgi:hypothetical protein